MLACGMFPGVLTNADVPAAIVASIGNNAMAATGAVCIFTVGCTGFRQSARSLSLRSANKQAWDSREEADAVEKSAKVAAPSASARWMKCQKAPPASKKKDFEGWGRPGAEHGLSSCGVHLSTAKR